MFDVHTYAIRRFIMWYSKMRLLVLGTLAKAITWVTNRHRQYVCGMNNPDFFPPDHVFLFDMSLDRSRTCQPNQILCSTSSFSWCMKGTFLVVPPICSWCWCHITSLLTVARVTMSNFGWGRKWPIVLHIANCEHDLKWIWHTQFPHKTSSPDVLR